jgi:hypothetical protein
MNSVREKTSASNDPVCKEGKAEFLIAQMIAQGLPMIALIAISFSSLVQDCLFRPISVPTR